MALARLQQRYPAVPGTALQHVLYQVANGNERAAAEALACMSVEQLRQFSDVGKQAYVVQQFVGITGAPESTARLHGSRNGWDLSAALEDFFAAQQQPDTQLVAAFERYKATGENEGDGSDAMQGEGLVRFCEDLGVDPYGDIAILVIAWLLNAAESYQFTRTEFVRGLKALGCFCMEDVGVRLESWRRQAQLKWKDFYYFVYRWTKAPTEKSLEPEAAIQLWRLLLQGERAWAYLEEWVAFLEERQVRGIGKDVWQQFADFTATHTATFSDYDSELGAWPVLFDEFVEYLSKTKLSSEAQKE